ncbi:MAG: cation diffusion facilitator family transporter [Fibrobacterota bacterium]
MAHGHEHSQEHAHTHGHDYKPSERKHLLIALAVNGAVMVLEAVGGWMTGSLALLSDAGHMFTHIFALATSYFAIVLASRDASDTRSFGFFRAEILATFVNSIFLFGVVVLIAWGAVRHLMNPTPIRVGEMIGIAFVGLATNLASFFLLRADSERDINIRSAFLHVLTDTFSSAVIIAGGFVMYWKRWFWLDPVLSLLISVLILIWAWRLLKESVNILLESAPRDVDVATLRETLRKEVPGVRGVHDVHVWVITSHLYAATLHVFLDDMPLSRSAETAERIRNLLREHFRIAHTNIQFEAAHLECEHKEGIQACGE